MSRALFLAKLKEGLAGLPQPQIDAVVCDYEFHFAEASATGQSEENIAARLGDPASLARELRGGLEKRHAAEAPSTAPSSAAAAGFSPRILGVALILLLLTGLAAAYYLAGRTIPPSVVTPSAGSPQQAISVPAPGPTVMILSGQVLDLGLLKQERIAIVID